jgi:hypothetical protein
MIESDIITIVRDPAHTLGKHFSFGADGKVIKKSAVSISLGIAEQRHVPDLAAMESLLTEVAEDSHAAIINSAFPLVPVDQPFLMMSENAFEKIGIKREDPGRTWPASLEYKEERWLGLGRFKEHTTPSSWVLLDRDIDEHTPKHIANLSYNEWLSEVDKLLPGVLKCGRLRAFSSSARVTVHGHPVGDGNGHTWVQVTDTADIERMRSAIIPRATDLGLAWTKPKFKRDTREVIAQSITTIIDPSVFVCGRLVFCGMPEVEHVF